MASTMLLWPGATASISERFSFHSAQPISPAPATATSAARTGRGRNCSVTQNASSGSGIVR
jgi:hypothetical protein